MILVYDLRTLIKNCSIVQIMKISTQIVTVMIATALVGSVGATSLRQAYAPRTCGRSRYSSSGSPTLSKKGCKKTTYAVCVQRRRRDITTIKFI